VDVVVARIRSFDPVMLGAGEAAADAGAALAAGELACGLGDDPELHAAAATSATASKPANRAHVAGFDIVLPRAMLISPGADTWPSVVEFIGL
jgi:hypothetical protein